MILTLQTFAAARELLGTPITLEVEEGTTTQGLRTKLLVTYPSLATLKDFAIARNEEYALPTDIITAADELVIIPPVSGG